MKIRRKRGNLTSSRHLEGNGKQEYPFERLHERIMVIAE
jgi:hypothetical protein